MNRPVHAMELCVALALAALVLLCIASPAAAIETVTIFADDCTTPKTVFLLGETACAKVDGVAGGDLNNIFLQWVGATGTTFGSAGTTPVTSDGQTFTQLLPTTGAGAEVGRWTARTVNISDSTTRVSANFRVPRMNVIGIHRDSDTTSYVRNSNDTGFGDAEVTFGQAGDVRLWGDWFGNGRYTPGFYRPSDGTFRISTTNTDPQEDIVFQITGVTGGQPVVGDWDGDGTQTVGVYVGNTVHLRNSLTSGPADVSFDYGIPGDQAIAGDFDGDGIWTIAVYRDGEVFIRNSNTTGISDANFSYGMPGDLATAGNWNAADGISKIGVYRPTNSVFYLLDTNDEGDADNAFTFGIPGDVPAPSAHNEAPVVTAGGTLNYTENDAATPIDPALTVTDMDSATLVGATVQITTNCTDPEDVLAFTNQNGITGNYEAASCLLTLTGESSRLNYQAALQSVRYSNTSDDPSTLARTVTWEVDDGSLIANLSAAATSTVNVAAAGDAPVLTAGATIGYTEGDAATVIDNTITVNDADSANLTQATAQITGNYQNGPDVLACPSGCNGLTPNFNAVNGTLTLNGSSQPLATYQAALRMVTYRNTGADPTATGATRTITWIGSDGTNASSPVTSTINITAINSTPALTAGGTLNYTEGDAATAIDNTITLTDTENGTVASATAQITTGYQNGQDVLSYVAALGITGDFNAGNGTLTLTGPAPVADFQTALRNVKYENTSQNPNTSARTVTWQVDDGAAANNLSNTPTSTINVAAVNDAPVVTAGATIGYTEGDAATVIDTTITITDADSTNLTQATAQITGNYQNGPDELSCPSGCNGLGANFNAGTGTLTLNGISAPLATYEAAMRMVRYRNTGDNPTGTGATRTITWQVNDGAAANNLSTTVTSTINITGVNDAPVVAAGANLNYTENNPATAIDTTLTVTDPDSTNLTGATAQITGNCANDQDVLSFVNQNGISGVYTQGSCLMTLTGSSSVANYQTALRSLAYSNTSDNPSTLLRTVTWQVNDGAAANNLSTSVTSTITVIAVNDAPVGGANKSRAVTGNVRVQVPLGTDSLLNGVTDPEGNAFTAQVDGSSTHTGDLVINANGTYSYNPKAGFTGTDTVKFKICDDGTPQACSAVFDLTLTIADMLWFIDNNAASCTTRVNGCGRLTNPYSGLADFAAENNGTGDNPAAGDNIFLYESVTDYSGALTLLDTQKLIGQDASEDLQTISGVTPAAGSDALPGMSSGNGTIVNITSTTTAVTLGQNNTLRGFRLGNVTSTGTALAGTSFGTLTLANGTTQAADLSISTNGRALNLNTGTIASSFAGITSSGGINNILLTNVQTTGTTDLGSGALSGATGNGFSITGQNGSFTYSGTISNSSANRAVSITSKTGGTVTLSGNINPSAAGAGILVQNNSGGGTITFSGSQKRISSGGTSGVNLSTNGGTTINFTGGGLDITTTSGAGFTATGGATAINVTGSGNKISSTTGTALTVTSSTIGASGLTFESISANGATNGILLTSTGTTGGLTVEGNSSGNCGGTVTVNTVGTPATFSDPDTADCTGGTIQSTTGVGISATTVGTISLTRMRIMNSGTDGINVSGTTGFTFSRGFVTDNTGLISHNGVKLANVSGTVTLQNSTFVGGPLNNIFVDNFNTNMTSFSLTDSVVRDNKGIPTNGIAANGLLMQIRGTSVLTSALIDNSVFDDINATGVLVTTGDTARIGNASLGAIVAPAASNSLIVSDSTFTDNNIGIDMSQSQRSNLAFQLLTNTITIHNSHSINVATAAGADTGPASHFHVGKVDGNHIGTQGTLDSGSAIGNGIRVVIQGDNTQGSVTVSNNTIREVANAGNGVISFIGQNGNATTGTGTARFKTTGNTIVQPTGTNQNLGCGGPCVDFGIFVLADEASPVCNVITGNTIYDLSTQPAGAAHVYLAERAGPPAGAQLTVEGTGGSNTAYISANNTLTGADVVTDEGGNTTQVAAGACGSFP